MLDEVETSDVEALQERLEDVVAELADVREMLAQVLALLTDDDSDEEE